MAVLTDEEAAAGTLWCMGGAGWWLDAGGSPVRRVTADETRRMMASNDSAATAKRSDGVAASGTEKHSTGGNALP